MGKKPTFLIGICILKTEVWLELKSDFLLAITQLSAEKNLPKEVVLKAVESALVSAYRKDNFAPNQDIQVKINPGSGRVEVWVEKTVVDVVVDSRKEITLSAARRLKPDIELGQPVMVEATPQNAGRIAAQTAKQNTVRFSKSMRIKRVILSLVSYSMSNQSKYLSIWGVPRQYYLLLNRSEESAIVSVSV